MPPIDLIDTNEEIIAMIALPGIAKENIDLAVTEDTLSITAKAMPRTASYLRREDEPRGLQEGDQAARRCQAGAGQGQVR